MFKKKIAMAAIVSTGLLASAPAFAFNNSGGDFMFGFPSIETSQKSNATQSKNERIVLPLKTVDPKKFIKKRSKAK